MIRCTVHFVGHVQGVGFRYTTCNIAVGHNVTGYVQNLHDGRVLLIAEGEVNAVKSFVDAVLVHMSGYIKSHTVDNTPTTGEFTDFDVRY